MVQRILVVCSLLLAMAGSAAANGRPPNSETLHFRVGHNSDIVVGFTFGMAISHDSGSTWQWMCEAAVGYAGVWDPIYQWTSSGALFATTFSGLRVNRNGCTFDTTPLGDRFATAFAAGADGALYVAMSDTSATTPDSKIYKSIDDGMTFNAGVLAPNSDPSDWQDSIVTAPSDAQRVYLSAYGMRGASGSMTRSLFLYKSTDGGASFTALPVTDFNPVSKDSTIDLVGVSPTDANVLYARVNYETLAVQTAIYRSADAGATWHKVVCATLPCVAGAPGVQDYVGAVAIDSHDNVYVGSTASGSWKSTDNGATFTNIPIAAGARVLQCLAVDATDHIWGCGDNYGADMMGIGETTDFATWTTKLKFQDITQPVTCAAGTPQHDTCQATTWCGLELQLGITSTVIECAGLVDAGAPPADAAAPVAKAKGCCDAGAGPSGLALAGLVGLIMWRPRRRRLGERA